MAVVFRYILIISLYSVVSSLGEFINLCTKPKKKCQSPQKVVVDMGEGVSPSSVLIERCFGGFKLRGVTYECVPRKTVNVTVMVSKDGVCQNTTVIKHDSCKLNIACGSKKQYDPEKKKCVFRYTCSTGSKWDNKEKKCLKIKR